MTFSYKMLFKPKSKDDITDPSSTESRFADRAPGAVYVYAEEIILAVNVAMATGRPLIIRGPSGSGKSSLAKSVAVECNLPYIEAVITSRTQARDLQWQVDLLKRLQDAQTSQLSPDWQNYITPGPMWWAFDPKSAINQIKASGDGAIPDGFSQFVADSTFKKAVLLIDEIDKADPDVPNNLLKPLGELCFVVEEFGFLVETKEPPLVFITTNDERDLPAAFLRRCVELDMPSFGRHRLIQVGRCHLNDAPMALLEAIADFLLEKTQGSDAGSPNAAEYLDMVRACIQLGIDPNSEGFEKLSRIILMQHSKGR
jgi:MoxR-like ATPase